MAAADLPPEDSEALEFLSGIAPSGPWFLVADRAGKWAGRRTLDARDLSDPATADRVVEFLRAHRGRDNVYFALNATRPGVTDVPSEDDVTAVRAVTLDVDLANRGSSEEDYDRVLSQIRAVDPPPTAIVFSGGGYQAHWLIDPPAPPASPAAERAVEVSRALAEAFGGDAVFNPNRIMRLPGTINVLNESKRARGRVPAAATLVEADWSRRWSVEAPLAPPARDGFDDLEEEWRERIATGDVSFLKGKDKSRSAATWAALMHLLRVGWTDAAIAATLLDPALGISAHSRAQANPERYVDRQIRHARAALARDYRRNEKGAIVASDLSNVRKALLNVGYRLAYDSFADRSTVTRPEGSPAPFDDPTLLQALFEIEQREKFRPAKEYFRDACTVIARESTSHPVVDYLSALAWDGVPRIDSWLIEYGEAEDTQYCREVGRLILLAAVCRVRCPGCKFDQMLVLEDPTQGTDKSTALAVLAVRDEWFTDSLHFDVRSKEAIEILSGKWIVEASELSKMSEAAIEHLKAFLSRTTDRARMSYDRLVTERPRSGVFFGTTNSTKYLRDEQNRRFWPVRTGRFDVAGIARDRDQLWAEAAHRQAQGESIRLDPKHWATAAIEQAKRRELDPWYDVVANNLDLDGLMLTDDMWKVVGRAPGQATIADGHRLGKILRELGWDRVHTSTPELGLRYFYQRGKSRRRIYVHRDFSSGMVEVGYDSEPFADDPDLAADPTRLQF